MVQVEGLNLSCVNELYRFGAPERFVGEGEWWKPMGFPRFFSKGWDVIAQALTELGSEQPQEICGFGSNGAGILVKTSDGIDDRWLLVVGFTVTAIAVWLFIKLQLEKKSGLVKDTYSIFCNSRFVEDFAGFPRFFWASFNPRSWESPPVSENRKTTSFEKRWNLGCLLQGPGLFQLVW